MKTSVKIMLFLQKSSHPYLWEKKLQCNTPEKRVSIRSRGDTLSCFHKVECWKSYIVYMLSFKIKIEWVIYWNKKLRINVHKHLRLWIPLFCTRISLHREGKVLHCLFGTHKCYQTLDVVSTLLQRPYDASTRPYCNIM